MSFIRKNNVFKIYFEVKDRLSRYPKLYFSLMRLRRGKSDNLIGKQTEIVIEGFPRSGNTFSVIAFQIAQQRQIVIGHHSHAPAQVIYAVQERIPTLVLIRKPIDAVISFSIRYPYIHLSQGLKSYIRFYNSIMPYRDKYVIATFKEVTCNFGKIIERINDYFNKSFLLFENSEKNVQKCFQIIEEMDRIDTGCSVVIENSVARPSKQRKLLKDVLKKEFQKEYIKSYSANAEAVYNKFINFR